MADFVPENFNDFRNRLAGMNAVTQGISGGVNVLASALNNRRALDQAKYNDALQAALRLRAMMQKPKEPKEPAPKNVPATSYNEFKKDFVKNLPPGTDPTSDNADHMARLEYAKTVLPDMVETIRQESHDGIPRDSTTLSAYISSFLKGTDGAIIRKATIGNNNIAGILQSAVGDPQFQSSAAQKGFDLSPLKTAADNALAGINNQKYVGFSSSIGNQINKTKEVARDEYRKAHALDFAAAMGGGAGLPGTTAYYQQEGQAVNDLLKQRLGRDLTSGSVQNFSYDDPTAAQALSDNLYGSGLDVNAIRNYKPNTPAK